MAALQVKNVPDDLHDALRRRAEGEGMTVSSYVLDVLRRELARPSWREWVRGLGEPTSISRDAIVRAIHEGREERERELESRLR